MLRRYSCEIGRWHEVDKRIWEVSAALGSWRTRDKQHGLIWELVLLADAADLKGSPDHHLCQVRAVLAFLFVLPSSTQILPNYFHEHLSR